MYFSGFADEAGPDLATQIAVTRELGWSNIESRMIDGTMIHDLPDAAFDRVCAQLADSGVRIDCFGSAIANWAKRIDQPFETSLAEARRSIPRMRRLGTRLVRIMSFAVLKDASGRVLDDQMEEERFRRLRALQAMFADAGLLPVHENCTNYGGLGWSYTLRLLEQVPGLKLVFDTGNPTHSDDHSAPMRPDGSRPKQSSWDFYQHVREHVAHVHIKDGWIRADGVHEHTWPGEGSGDVARVLGDLLARGYGGGLSIEPHLKSIFHDPARGSTATAMRETYVAYGRRVMALVGRLTQSAISAWR